MVELWSGNRNSSADHSYQMLPNADYIVPVEIEGQTHNVYVIKRPGVDNFLKEMGRIYEVVVFTASLSKVNFPTSSARQELILLAVCRPSAGHVRCRKSSQASPVQRKLLQSQRQLCQGELNPRYQD